MADIKQKFGATTAFTLTLASLASSATAGRESTKIDNTADLYLDALVSLNLALTTGTIGNDKAAYVYAYGSLDNTNFPDTVTGADAGITLNDPTQLRLIGVINLLAQSTTYKGGPFSVAAAFGGVLPPYWGIVVRNYSGIALAASGHAANWRGVLAQSG
jgi:hypothetical protein